MSLKGIDIFSGAGGMAVGAALAGVEVSVAIENDAHAATTYQNNHPSSDMICADIRSVSNFSRLRPRGETVLFGGPPCQGFSTSNQRTRNSSNENNWLFKEFLRAVVELQPEWVVFENVPGIAHTEGAIFLEYIIDGLRDMNYFTQCQILNAQDFGVPQARSRLFVTAGKNRQPVSCVSSPAANKTTVYDAIHDLPVLANGASNDTLKYYSSPKSSYAQSLRKGASLCTGNLVTKNADHIVERYRHVPQGGNWSDIPEKLMSNYRDRSRCHTGVYRRLDFDQPSSVIGNYRKNMLIHPEQNRGLSVREAARLQSFPDDYKFYGSIGFQQQQVGNAVPPLLAQRVFESLQ